jgi:hypothetical protein
MNQNDFLSEIKAIWQSVQLPHEALLKRARYNLIWYWCGIVYTTLVALASVVGGIGFLIQSEGDLLFWMLGLTLLFLIPVLSYISIKLSWPYVQWRDKSAKGTLTQLIRQCEIEIKLSLFARNTAITYVAVLPVALAVYYLDLTRISFSNIIAGSTGLMASSLFIFVWLHFRIKRKRQQLATLLEMQSDCR